jgi:hypothetical protein
MHPHSEFVRITLYHEKAMDMKTAKSKQVLLICVCLTTTTNDTGEGARVLGQDMHTRVRDSVLSQ